MWAGEVELPDEIVAAQRDGKLTMFVGAGVSRGAPTSLPDFFELATIIGGEARIRFRRHEELDRFLGRVADTSFPVKRRTMDLLGGATRPNELHRALARLHRDIGSMRIVTTNFDLNLSAAVEEAWGQRPVEYFAPALPLGDEFSGIVYLHGAVSQPVGSLVITDRDFSRAYLTRAWARTFLLDVFNHGPVLFIGYSLNDPTLRSLARGLPARTQTYALVPIAEAARFQALDVSPITYPVRRGKGRHRALTEAVSDWATQAGWGLSDHRQRIRDVTRSGPPVSPRDIEYVQGVLRDPARVQFFAEFATDVAWVDWAGSEVGFRSLFVRLDTHHGTSESLAWWFAEKFAVAHPSQCLAVVHRWGGQISDVLWLAIAHQVWAQKASSEVRAQWVPFLLDHAPEDTRDYLDYLFAASPDTADNPVLLLLLVALTRPFVSLRPAFLADRAELEVGIQGSDYWLGEAWKNVISGRLPDLAIRLVELMTANLELAEVLNQCLVEAGYGADVSAFLRPRVTVTPQYPRWSDFLLDFTRDSWSWLAKNDVDSAQRFLQYWLASDVPALRRLGIYGLAQATWLTVDERISEVVRLGLLLDDRLGEDAMPLVDLYPRASPQVQDQLLAALDSADSGRSP